MPQPNSLNQWLAFIEASHPSEIDLGLTRVAAVADALSLAPRAAPVITVAGTNGKGSTVAFMRAIAEAHGLRAGCYTSPHFLRYNERVHLAGREATDAELCEAFAAVEEARCQVGVSLTYFEYGTLAAFWLFSQQPLDLWLLEVGLGGRLDAVNLIDADVAVVTTVALDHQDWLGSDREKIGFEKAGIARSQRPLIYGEPDMPASVASHAEQLGAPLLQWGQTFGPQQQSEGQWRWYGQDQAGNTLEFGALPEVQLPFANASTSIQALVSAGLVLRDEALRQGLSHASLTGRMQRLFLHEREFILDVAHNPHAARYLAEHLSPCAGKTWCVAAMLADKDIDATLALLKASVDRWQVASLDTPRAARAERLAEALAGSEVAMSESVSTALAKVMDASALGDRILVMGSFHTVAAALEQLQE